MADGITCVGLDLHKDGIADSGLRGEVREYGRIATPPAALVLCAILGQDGARLRFF